jgi:hypothetical protein
VRLPVATHGDRPHDWFWGVEGELVALCDGCWAPDCDQSFIGLASGGHTSSARIGELIEVKGKEVLDVLTDHVVGCGQPPGDALQVFNELTRLGMAWPVGTVIVRNGDRVGPAWSLQGEENGG